MTKRLRPALALTVFVLAVLAASATALSVKLTPVKGATYAGLVSGPPITIKVDRTGHTAKIGLADAPLFCSSGAAARSPTAPSRRRSQAKARSPTRSPSRRPERTANSSPRSW